MTPVCPRCQEEIPAERVNAAQGLAHCARCNQMFSLAALAGGAAGPAAVAKPAGCDIQHFREADSAGFILPPAGVARSGGILVFSLVWNVFVAFFICLTVFQGEWLGALFMLPFIAVGAGMGLAALYGLFGTTSLLLDRENVRLERKLLNRRWTKSRPLAELSGVARHSVYQENDRDVWAVHLAFGQPGAGVSGAPGLIRTDPARGIFGGGFNVALRRGVEEHVWLVSELRQLLFALGHPAGRAE